MDIVNEIKMQYERVLCFEDSERFKSIAEYYLTSAAKLRKKDIQSSGNRLLIRNSQKRLFLGVGCELLLKAYYLKNNYCVNKLTENFAGEKSPIHKLADINPDHIKNGDTFTISPLIDKLSAVSDFDDIDTIERGLKIAMIFRNKEGHTSFSTHQFDRSNYRDIENAVVSLYRNGFEQILHFRISMEKNEKAKFIIGT